MSDAAPTFPPDWGVTFTPTIHSKAEGATDPANNKSASPLVVLVTGAGKGLGYHIALAYARAGASGLIISSRTQSDLDTLSAELLAINPKLDLLSRVCDTTRDADLRALAAETKARFHRLDVAVANAGIISKYLYDGADGASGRRLPAGILEDDDFERVIDINLLGSYRVAKHFVPLLIATADGGPQAYVVITSLAGRAPSSAFTPVAYNVSKIAVDRMAEHIHADHCVKDGVQAFAVHPGAVLTPQTRLHSTGKGDIWERLLTDDIGLCGGFLTWLTAQRREWLSGRYLSVNWDPAELEAMKEQIVKEDKLKFRMVV